MFYSCMYSYFNFQSDEVLEWKQMNTRAAITKGLRLMFQICFSFRMQVLQECSHELMNDLPQ